MTFKKAPDKIETPIRDVPLIPYSPDSINEDASDDPFGVKMEFDRTIILTPLVIGSEEVIRRVIVIKAPNNAYFINEVKSSGFLIIFGTVKNNPTAKLDRNQLWGASYSAHTILV